jgi:peptidoglycan hydrolase-like protein with peptidoglycan-binding domain
MKMHDDTVRRTRRRWLAITTVMLTAVLAAAMVATVVGRQLRSPAQLAAEAEPPAPAVVTATVERRLLTEPVVLRGKVQPGASLKLLPPAAAVGTGSVITKVLAKPDTPLREGQVLLERAGDPLLGLELPFPLYRDITAGLSGPDVTEVQKALNRLGYHATVSGRFDAQTQRAVAALYADRGYAAPTTTTGTSGGTGNPPASTASSTPVPSATSRNEPSVVLPQAHVMVLDRAGHRISAVNVRVGDVLTDPKAELFELDREPPVIVALAARDQRPLLRTGQVATVVDDAAGTDTRAEVTAVGTQPVNGADGQSGFEVRLRFTGTPLDAGGERAVRLSIQVADGASPVLAIPVTAVFSHPDGTTFVTVAGNGRERDIPISTGQMAGGWVEIHTSTDALPEGTQVVVSEHPNGRP